jgi:hypothetical protein
MTGHHHGDGDDRLGHQVNPPQRVVGERQPRVQASLGPRPAQPSGRSGVTACHYRVPSAHTGSSISFPFPFVLVLGWFVPLVQGRVTTAALTGLPLKGANCRGRAVNGHCWRSEREPRRDRLAARGGNRESWKGGGTGLSLARCEWLWSFSQEIPCGAEGMR